MRMNDIPSGGLVDFSTPRKSIRKSTGARRGARLQASRVELSSPTCPHPRRLRARPKKYPNSRHSYSAHAAVGNFPRPIFVTIQYNAAEQAAQALVHR